jgi:TonB family protein
VVCLAPRVLRNYAPSAPAGASVRPLNFTVRQPMHHQDPSTAVILALAVVLSVAVLGRGTTVLAEEATSFETKSLPIKSVSRPDGILYPSAARRKSETGRVCLAYSVDAAGRVQNIAVLESAGSILDDQAKKLLSAYIFDVPSDWVANGGAKKRYRRGFIFQLSNKPQVAPFDDAIPTLVITGSGLGP